MATTEKNSKKKREMRAEIAGKINKLYKEKMRAEDVTDCDGCKTEERLFSGSQKCEIRKCTRDKGIENCAHCSEYPCEKLREFFVAEPNAKARLDGIRSRII